MLEIRLDGHLLKLPPRRAEMIRRLVAAQQRLDLVAVGAVEIHFSQDKVSLRIIESEPPSRAGGWSEWLKSLTENKQQA